MKAGGAAPPRYTQNKLRAVFDGFGSISQSSPAGKFERKSCWWQFPNKPT